MREILFRGKTKTIRKEWITGSLVNTYEFYSREQHCFIVDDDFQDHDEWEIDPETVGQYTGLKDNNGKRIFDGDIVRHEIFGVKQIVYGNIKEPVLKDCCGFMYDGTLAFLSSGDSFEIELIGNIHDNPELLEVQG